MTHRSAPSHRAASNPVVRALLAGGAALMLACGGPGGGASAAETPAEPAPEATQESAPLMQFEEANGFEIYQRYCLVCHGELGEGDGFNAFNLDPKPRSLVDDYMRTRVSDRELTEVIRLGGRKRGRSPLMPPWGRTLGDRQIRYVVSYIRLLQRKAQAAAETSGEEAAETGQ